MKEEPHENFTFCRIGRTGFERPGTGGTCVEDAVASKAAAHGGALAGDRYRVIVSTDIGGTDPDDFRPSAYFGNPETLVRCKP